MCISYGLHRGTVVIPKTVNPKRIVENFNSTSLSLTEDDMKALAGIDKGLRLFKVTTLYILAINMNRFPSLYNLYIYVGLLRGW